MATDRFESQETQDDIDNVVSYTLTPYPNFAFTGTSQRNVRVNNKICNFSVELNIPAGNYSASTKIAYGFPKPSVGQYLTCQSTTGNRAMLYIDVNGELIFYGNNNLASQNYFQITNTYIIAEE